MTPDGARASGTIRVASLTTDHAGRDDDLRSPQFLDAAAAPEMRFETDPPVAFAAHAFVIKKTA